MKGNLTSRSDIDHFLLTISIQIRTETQGPSPGYIFIPKGDVYITRNCRSLSHDAKQTVYTVYVNTTPLTSILENPLAAKPETHF